MFQRVATAVVVVLVLACPAFAQDRLVWRHEGGHFENTVGNKWVEISPDGRFEFREVYRGRNFIEPYDGSRDCRVRLTGRDCLVKFGAGPFRCFYNGHWER